MFYCWRTDNNFGDADAEPMAFGIEVRAIVCVCAFCILDAPIFSMHNTAAVLLQSRNY